MKHKRLEINTDGASTKVLYLVDALSKAIEQGIYQPGEALPSVNQISKEYNLSRDTVFKAYQELKQRNLVDSTPAKGYHVMGALTKILLILDVYSPFKDVLYNAFVNNLPKNYKVDLVFHFYNERVFESVIFDSVGRHNYYIVMNFSAEQLHDSVKRIDPGRLLLLDLGDFDKGAYAYVCQDFGQSVYESLATGWNQIKKYKEFVLCLPDESEHPKITTRYFKKFCKDFNIQSTVIKSIRDREVQPGQIWLLIQQKDLVEIVKNCHRNNFKIGHDVGLLAYNDTPMYEIIDNGISAISTDFALMGSKAAEFVLTRQRITESIPARLVMRGSI
jgi:DNA-binding transcriptional regulator YhcF (GntR family)